MAKQNKLNYFEPVNLQYPTDQVIDQIHALILKGHIKPGEKLPSAKRLEERMGLPRGIITRAISMMETYGIVRTVPQSGTYIADICVEALDGLMSNIVALKMDDIGNLGKVRYVLESHAVQEVVANATDAELDELTAIQDHMEEVYQTGEADFDLDLVFHLKLAAFSGNPVLKSTLTRLIMDMINLLGSYSADLDKTLLDERMAQAIVEHRAVLDRLIARDSQGAVEAIQNHFHSSQAFRKEHQV